MLDTIEKTLNKILSKNFEGFEIDSFPAKFEDYNFTSHNGCLLIRYEGSDFSNQNTITAVNQSETYTYSIIAGFRFCNSSKDCNKWIKLIKQVLQGYLINGYRTVIKRIRFLDEIEGDFWYGCTISLVYETKDLNSKNEYWWAEEHKRKDI